MPTPTTISSYDFDYFTKVLKIIENPQFQKIVQLYNTILNDQEIRDFIAQKKKGFFERYKIVDDVKTKIGSLEKTNQDQAKIIDVLNKRNIKLLNEPPIQDYYDSF